MFRQMRRLGAVIVGMVLALSTIVFGGDNSIKKITPKQAREIKKSGEKFRGEQKQREKEKDQQIKGKAEGLRRQLGATHPQAAQY